MTHNASVICLLNMYWLNRGNRLYVQILWYVRPVCVNRIWDKLWGQAIFYGHVILTEDVFVSQLSSSVGN